MNKEQLYSISFQIILHGGNARSLAMEAMTLAKENHFEEAEQKIREAEQELQHAHHHQTSLIQAEASGDQYDIPIILIHAQDHLMTAMTLKDLAKEIVDLRKIISRHA
jgi:cellobiose PTS system EIIA component